MMIDVPTVSWNVTVIEVVLAVVMFGVGYLTHEAMHIGVLEALHIDYSVAVLPDGWRGFLGTGTGIDIRIEALPSRPRLALVLLAPLVAAAPPLVAWAVALSYPVVDAGVALVLGLWFVAAIPGLHDIVTVATYDPTSRVPTEVST